MTVQADLGQQYLNSLPHTSSNVGGPIWAGVSLVGAPSVANRRYAARAIRALSRHENLRTFRYPCWISSSRSCGSFNSRSKPAAMDSTLYGSQYSTESP